MIITLSSFVAADARELRDASIEMGSFSLVSPDAAFDPADEGKAIVVAGAGASGTKLSTTIAEIVSGTQATLAASASTTVNATGAVVGTDCGPGLASALDALIAAKGGELVIDGLFFLASPVSKSFGIETSGISAIISGTGTDSAIWVGVPPASDAIGITSGSLRIRNISFVGIPSADRDARRVFNLSAMAASFEGCGFLGLLAAEAVIYADQTALATAACDFGGTFVTSDPAGLQPRSVIENKNWRSYRDESSSFVDYGYWRGQLYSKSGSAGTTGWIRADSPSGATGARGESVFWMRGTILDEGALHGIILKPTTGTIAHVHLQGLRQNLTTADSGRGVECHRVQRFTMDRCWQGLSTVPTLIGHWEDCQTVLIDSHRLSESVDRISAKNVGALTIRDTDGIVSLSLLNTSYHPVQSRFAPYAIIKDGAISDSDFLAPPAIGTSGFDNLNKRRYEKTVSTGGWIYFDMDGGDRYGPELVVNGDMAAGTTGWTAGNGATLSVVGGALRVTNGTVYGRAYQAVPTVVGQRYQFSGAIPGGDAGRLIRVGTTQGAGDYAAFSHVGGSAAFVALSTTTYITLILDSEQAGKFADFDSISVRAS